jgi:hypothetical protein
VKRKAEERQHQVLRHESVQAPVPAWKMGRVRNSILMPAVARTLALMTLAACASPHVQTSDPTFDAIVAEPAFRGGGPRLLFDDAHNNFHRSDGRYAPFVTLMRNDGFMVTSNTSQFDAASLRGHDVLVIVNAEGPTTGEPAFAAQEIEAVASWVEAGGSLLLVADHSPFGRAATAMAEQFGVTMADSFLKDETHSDPSLPGPFFLLFTRENGLLADHPITRGLRNGDRIDRVVTFGGQALRATTGVDPLLRLSPDARIVRDRSKPAVSEPAGTDAVHAVAIEHGRGRVVILGEAAALTAQVITGDAAKAAGVAELRVGMSRSDIDNKQFALNIVRWLARRL